MLNAYVALVTTIKMTHVRDINLEGTLYFLCKRWYILAHACRESNVPDFRRELNLSNNSRPPFRRVRRRKRTNPSRSASRVLSVIICDGRTCYECWACGMLSRASPRRGCIGLFTIIRSVRSRQHPDGRPQRSRTISLTLSSTRHSSRSSQTNRMLSKHSPTCIP